LYGVEIVNWYPADYVGDVNEAEVKMTEATLNEEKDKSLFEFARRRNSFKPITN
jgi:hypothetical protein